MNDENLIARRKATLGPTYQNFYDKPLHLVRGSGTRLWDVDGREYIDCYNNVVSVPDLSRKRQIALMFSMSWQADNGGLFIGTFFGRTPMDKNISPKKTREGIIGGLLFP